MKATAAQAVSVTQELRSGEVDLVDSPQHLETRNITVEARDDLLLVSLELLQIAFMSRDDLLGFAKLASEVFGDHRCIRIFAVRLKVRRLVH